MKNKRLPIVLLFIIAVYTNSCVEPFDIKTLSFENALVIEATISNEKKHQLINLSRTFELEDNGPIMESNAIVKIVDDLQNIFIFSETTPGKYLSNQEFGASANRKYQLKIVTSEGKSYSSKLTQLTNISQIDKVYIEKSDDGNGVNIFVDSYNPNENSRYYRFEFEETYQIIAPNWRSRDLIVVSKDSLIFDTVERDENKKICYNTIYSIGIIQTETNILADNKITRFLVRNISKDNLIISHRYSMLLKQYVQSQEAYTFYKTLNDLSETESLFSQNQPGFIVGNIFSENNAEEKVIGFFEVSSVTTKRIFFNPEDLDLIVPFPRPYPVPCHLTAPELNPRVGNSLFDYLESGSLLFYGSNGPGSPPLVPPVGGPYIMTQTECGDCTKIASNIVPDFWVD